MFFNLEFESMVAESWSKKPCYCNTSPSNLVISNFGNLEYFSVILLVETGVSPRIVDEDTAVSMFFNTDSILVRVSFISPNKFDESWISDNKVSTSALSIIWRILLLKVFVTVAFSFKVARVVQLKLAFVEWVFL